MKKRIFAYMTFLDDDGLPTVYKISGKSIKHILLSVCKAQYGWPTDEKDNIIPLEKLTISMLKEEINEQNGDGCMYILSIITTKGKLIFSI